MIEIPKRLSFHESRLSEERLDEIMDKALKNIKKKVNKNTGEAEFSFVMEGNTPLLNEYPKDVTYTVKFSRNNVDNTYIQRPDLLPESSVGVKYKGVSLTFENSESHMSELADAMEQKYGYDHHDYQYSPFAIYGTIARILIDYLDYVSDSVVQGIHFVTAHEGLVRPYIILCKEAQKKGNLVWTRPVTFSGQRSEGFVLLRRSIVDKVRDVLLGNKGE